MSGSSSVLVAESLVRRYDERIVIDHVSLTIAPGEMVSLMGASGCGKTTLLHILGTLDRPDGGRVLLRARDPASLSDTARAAMRREELGFVFQQSNLLPSLTARENVALPAWRATGQRRASLDRAEALLDRFGLAARADASGRVLSLGEAQRVAVARALINQPQMVLADEPTGSLDSEASLEVLDAMAEVCRTGAALLIVTHDPNVAARCARRLVMRDGRLAPDELPSALGGTSAASAG
jgi:putative ABC transport system ATP-binding protein